MAYELYEALGVDSGASAEEIKRAYYRMVRKHPPEEDPHGFARIRAAYETLSDPDARANYDDIERHGAQISTLNAQAQQHMENEKWDEAIRLLKRVLVLAPGLDGVRNQLALCYAYSECWDESIAILQRLVKKCPEVGAYHGNLGHAYHGKAEQLTESIGREASDTIKAYEHALAAYDRAAEVDPINSGHSIMAAQILFFLGRHQDAIDRCERAIVADKKTDFGDFEALLLICLVSIATRDLSRVHTTVDRILQLLPEDREVREYVAYRFASLGCSAAEAHIFDEASVLLEAATRLDPTNRSLLEVRDEVDLAKKADAELTAMLADRRLIGPLREIVRVRVGFMWGYLDKDAASASLRQNLASLSAFDPSTVIHCLSRMKTCYPALWRLTHDLLSDIESSARGGTRLGLDNASGRAAGRATRSPGTRFAVGCACGLAGLALFGPLGAAAGFYLGHRLSK